MGKSKKKQQCREVSETAQPSHAKSIDRQDCIIGIPAMQPLPTVEMLAVTPAALLWLRLPAGPAIDVTEVSALHAAIWLPILANASMFLVFQQSIHRQFDALIQRLDRIKTKMVDHETRITRVEERTSPLAGR